MSTEDSVATVRHRLLARRWLIVAISAALAWFPVRWFRLPLDGPTLAVTVLALTRHAGYLGWLRRDEGKGP